MRQIDNPDVYAKYHCARWYKLRKLKKLEANGLCERCLKKGKYVVGEIVHHKEYITLENFNDDNVMYNLDNLELLCPTCHQLEHFSKDLGYYFDEEGNVCNGKED